MPFERGEILLVAYPFTDQVGAKRRPALVVSSDDYNATCPDVVVAQITSRVDAPPRVGDHMIKQWKSAGLIAPSLVRARLATLQSSRVIRTLGRVSGGDMTGVSRGLRSALSLRGSE